MLNPPTTIAIAGLARISYVIVARLANKCASALLIAFLVLAASSAAPAGEPRIRIETTAGKSVEVSVELATTPGQHTRGLMFRQHLDPYRGMLFVFGEDTDRTFWMKNTPVSLDIIFIDSQRRIVGIQADTVPYSERQLRVGRPSRYVLEVNAGFCAREGVEVGNSLAFQDIDR